MIVFMPGKKRRGVSIVRFSLRRDSENRFGIVGPNNAISEALGLGMGVGLGLQGKVTVKWVYLSCRLRN